MEAPPSPLSSRPKRSEAEGSAVRPSDSPNLPYQTSTPNRSVIPTGAKRSGGTCCSSSSASDLNGSPTLPFVIPTEAEGSAVQRTSRGNVFDRAHPRRRTGQDSACPFPQEKGARSAPTPHHVPTLRERTKKTLEAVFHRLGRRRRPCLPPSGLDMRRKCYKKMEADSGLSCTSAIEWRPGTNRIADQRLDQLTHRG
jgi:hypothetical protein